MKAAFEKLTAAKCEKRSTEAEERGKKGEKGRRKCSAVCQLCKRGRATGCAAPKYNSRGSCRLLTLRLKWSMSGKRGSKGGEGGKRGEEAKDESVESREKKGGKGRPGQTVSGIDKLRRQMLPPSLLPHAGCRRGCSAWQLQHASLRSLPGQQVGSQTKSETETKRKKKPKAEKPILKLNLGNRFGGSFCPHVCFNCVNTLQCIDKLRI